MMNLRYTKLYSVFKIEKKANEDYNSFIKKLDKNGDDFYRKNGQIIEDINLILTLIVFSECASFNPHLILGRMNMNESILKLIQSPLSVEIDIKELRLENVINYK